MGQPRRRPLEDVAREFETATEELAGAAAASEKHWRTGAKLRKTRDDAQAKVDGLAREIRDLVETAVTR